jgi:hypothetical protein
LSNDNYDRLTKAELIELLKKDLKTPNLEVTYDPKVDFAEREEHWAAKKQKQRMFNLTKGKGMKGIEKEAPK